MATRRKKTPVTTCGICGNTGHTSAGHEYVGTGIYSGNRRMKKNILGKKKKR